MNQSNFINNDFLTLPMPDIDLAEQPVNNITQYQWTDTELNDVQASLTANRTALRAVHQRALERDRILRETFNIR